MTGFSGCFLTDTVACADCDTATSARDKSLPEGFPLCLGRKVGLDASLVGLEILLIKSAAGEAHLSAGLPSVCGCGQSNRGKQKENSESPEGQSASWQL